MWAALITSIAVLITSIATLISVLRVRHEVRTGNAQTLGTLANAIETRRIDAIPTEDRTEIEKEHYETQ
jgi:hypothetical protein